MRIDMAVLIVVLTVIIQAILQNKFLQEVRKLPWKEPARSESP
jgi:hypothetical protein